MRQKSSPGAARRSYTGSAGGNNGNGAPSGMDKEPRSIEEIEAELEDLRGRLPAHSVRPHMMIQLEELEDELEAAKKRAAAGNG